MKRKYTLLYIGIIMGAMTATTPVSAQKQLTANDSLKQKKSLQNTKEKQEKTIKNLQSDIDKYNSDSATIVSSEEYKLFLELQHEISQLQKDSATIALDAADNMREARQQCEQQKKDLMQQHLADSTRLVRLTAERDELQHIRQNYISNLISSVDDVWLKKNYSQMTLSELENACKKYDDNSSYDGVAAAGEKMKSLLHDFRIYNAGRTAINSKYDAGSVSRLKNQIKELAEQTKDATKQNELKELGKLLSSYKASLKIFKDIIRIIDDTVKEEHPQNGFNKLIKALVSNKAEEVNGIKAIPWLNEQFEEYYDIIKKDYKAPNKARNTIMSLTL